MQFGFRLKDLDFVQQAGPPVVDFGLSRPKMERQPLTGSRRS